MQKELKDLKAEVADLKKMLQDEKASSEALKDKLREALEKPANKATKKSLAKKEIAKQSGSSSAERDEPVSKEWEAMLKDLDDLKAKVANLKKTFEDKEASSEVFKGRLRETLEKPAKRPLRSRSQRRKETPNGRRRGMILTRASRCAKACQQRRLRSNRRCLNWRKHTRNSELSR